MPSDSKVPQQASTMLFLQKETQGSYVYGNSVIRAFYVPKAFVQEISIGGKAPEMITLTIAPRESKEATNV